MSRIKQIILFLSFLLPFLSIAAEVNRDSLQRILYITNIPSEKIIVLNMLSNGWMEDDPLKAYNFAEQAFVLSETIEDYKGKAEALFYLGQYSSIKEDYVAALNYFLESQEGFNKTGDEQFHADVLLELGKTYQRRFEYEKSLKVLFEAMEVYKELNHPEKLAETYNLIGGTYYDQEKYDKAFEYFQNSMVIWEDIKDEVGLAKIYNNVGEIYRMNGHFDKALDFYNRAISLNLKISRLDYLAINYDNIGNIFLLQSEYDSSLFYMEKSLELSNSIKDNNRIAAANISLGKLYSRLDSKKKALQYFESGIQIASEIGYLINIKEAAKGMSNIYKEQDQFENAYRYHRMFKRINDSLFNIQNLEKITQLEMNLIFDHEQKIKSIQRQKTNYKYFLFAIGLISVLVLFILLYGRLRIKINHAKIEEENLQLEKQQLKEELDFKNRELATNVMYLVKKNELINYISDKLLKVKTKFKKENQDIIQQIILDLQANIDIDIWKVFEERFREVHMDFYKKLNQNFPNLRDNDRKLCALLRLNMSTKDIAAITHRNPNSIEVARTRLRKKLNISNREISLVSFLSSI